MSVDIFRHADAALMVMLNEMSREFQNFGTTIGFEELNVLETRRRVNAMYKRMDGVIRREYRKIARKAYREACDDANYRTDGFDEAEFVEGVLRAYDSVSDFVYTREWIRKRDRLFESIIATERGNQEMRRNLKRGLDVLANQVRQYADNITAQARLLAFKRAGADVLVWITEDDEKVCSVCRPRHEQFYPIEMLPDWPAHWHCRCRLEWVDMEERERTRGTTAAAGTSSDRLRRPPSLKRGIARAQRFAPGPIAHEMGRGLREYHPRRRTRTINRGWTRGSPRRDFFKKLSKRC